MEGYDVIIDEINTRPFLTPKFIKNGEQVVALIHQLAREYWFYETPFPISYIGYHFLEDRWLRNYVNIPTVTISESTKKDLLNLGFKKYLHCICRVKLYPFKQSSREGIPSCYCLCWTLEEG
jgi:hypothetical protein